MRGVTDLLQVALKQRKVALCPRSYPGLVRESRSSRALGQQLRGDTRVEVDCLANCRDGPAPKRHTHRERERHRERQRDTERDRERQRDTQIPWANQFCMRKRMGHGNMRHTHTHTHTHTDADADAHTHTHARARAHLRRASAGLSDCTAASLRESERSVSGESSSCCASPLSVAVCAACAAAALALPGIMTFWSRERV